MAILTLKRSGQRHVLVQREMEEWTFAVGFEAMMDLVRDCRLILRFLASEFKFARRRSGGSGRRTDRPE